jgi:hypothetical protein
MNKIENLIKITLTLLFLSSPAIAGTTLSVGTSLSFLNINDPDFEYTTNSDQLQLSSISIGFNQRVAKTPFIVNISTNRLINREVSREVRSKKNGAIFINKTKTEVDSLSLGYQLGRYIPNAGIANVGVEKSIYYAGKFLGAKQQHAILGIFGLTYIVSKDISITSTFALPNRELNLDAGVVFGVNYNFSI